MKTHDLAKALTLLSKILQGQPNQDLNSVSFGERRQRPNTDSAPAALSTLVALSRFDKAQWLQVIRDHNFPIEVRARDASRDILGKLLNFLEENAEARKRLSSEAQISRPDTSPELMKALQLLLRT